MAQGHITINTVIVDRLSFFQNLDVMNENTENNKVEPPPPPLPIPNVVEDSIASRTKEITKRPKRERSPSELNNYFYQYY
jgi:hypothetical protein